MREVVEKVLSEPIRPDFAIVSVGSGFRSNAVLTLVCDCKALIFNLGFD